MHRLLVAGGVLTAAGIAGYALGIRTALPGRSFSVTAVMVGVALLTIGWSEAGDP